MKKLFFLLLFLFVAILGFSQSRHIPQSTKKIVYTRDGGVCQCCGSNQNIEYDHIVPFSCGGGNEPSNIQLLCMSCNRSKSNSCTCKIHNKTVGKNCCDGKTKKKKTVTSTQCTGKTKSGRRCKNRTKNKNGRCHVHQ